MAEHTPMPWMMQNCGELCPDDVMIVADMGIHNGIQQISTVAKALSMRQPADVTAANAALIVKAVNSHAALVGALHECLNLLVFDERVKDASFNPRLADSNSTIGIALAALVAAEVSP